MSPTMLAFPVNGKNHTGFIIHNVDDIVHKVNSDPRFKRDLASHGINVTGSDISVEPIGLPREDRMLVTWELFTAYDISVGSIKTLSLSEWNIELKRLVLPPSETFVA